MQLEQVVEVLVQVKHGAAQPMHTYVVKSGYKPTVVQSDIHEGEEELYK